MINTKTLLPYKTMPVWTAQSIPKAFLEKHNTKEGTWAKLTILSGSLVFYQLSPDGRKSRGIFLMLVVIFLLLIHKSGIKFRQIVQT